MNTSRRAFLKTSALAATGMALFANEMMAASKPGKALVGIQLYSIRDEMGKDPLGTLKQLAAMGYKHVEHANYRDRKFYGYSATEFKKILDDLGMTMPSGHTVMGRDHWDESKKEFTSLWKYTVEDAATLGQKFVISPWLDESLRKTHDDLLRYMEVFNKSGELCQKSGMKFGYHNHDFEFSQKLDGKILYDLMLQNTDPDLVMQQLDFGNMVNGGARAAEWINKYPGRFQSLHVKDEIASQSEGHGYESTILGQGIVGVKDVLALARKKGGSIHLIIEQEAYQGKAPLDCVKEDLAIMKTWGYK
ncbi:MAG: sugar phosphate isomerase/epimerase [Bacteroidetes bacterium]|nr:MAG: sugar phosphate isomerase/epimerase [Bacteroidota bacterium]